MTDPLIALRRRVDEAERELQQALAAWHAEAAETVQTRLHRLSAEFRAEQRRLRRGLLAHLASIGLLMWLTAPFIYALIIPMLLTDLFTTVYQRVCFPIYGIPRVSRRDYVVLDRHRLPYLNALEKLNCLYCGYANGVIAYAREIASRTEQYFCPIKHATPPGAPHARYANFVDYADAQAYRERQAQLRKTAGEP